MRKCLRCGSEMKENCAIISELIIAVGEADELIIL